jgi:hypothetical protein
MPEAVCDREIRESLEWTSSPEAAQKALLEKAREVRIEAIRALVEAEEPSAASAVTGALQHFGLPLAVRSDLIMLAEQVSVTHEKLRSRLASLLLAHARQLRDAVEAAADPPLWAALRRFSSLARASEAARLCEFLRPVDSATTRQAALAGVHSILEFQQLPDDPEAARLRWRVTELASKYLDNDWLISGQNTALALASFIAATLAQSESAVELARHVAASGRPRFLRRSLQTLVDVREVRRGRGLPITRHLADVIEALGGGATPESTDRNPEASV